MMAYNAIAHQLAEQQRDIGVAEFFSRNRHLLGFDNKRKALMTTIKEAVDNSLDACEDRDYFNIPFAKILGQVDWYHNGNTGMYHQQFFSRNGAKPVCCIGNPHFPLQTMDFETKTGVVVFQHFIHCSIFKISAEFVLISLKVLAKPFAMILSILSDFTFSGFVLQYSLIFFIAFLLKEAFKRFFSLLRFALKCLVSPLIPFLLKISLIFVLLSILFPLYSKVTIELLLIYDKNSNYPCQVI